jgi:N-methylhydantoinase A
MAARIGIDTGGTFTDVVRWSPRGVVVHKLPSTPDDPGLAVLRGLAAVRRRPDEPVDVVHGTTVGLNAVLQGRLPRTLFATNKGFRDLIEIGRQARTDLYALEPDRPQPPVPRALRLEVDCRRGPDGAVLRALTARAISDLVARARALRPEAIAIGFLHAPAAPADERRCAAALRRALPEVPVSCSAEVLPAFGEYERFSAAILNAAIAQLIGRYTARLTRAIGAGRLRLLRSSLGILPPAEAERFPARAMFSGPAGGVLATRRLCEAAGLPRAVAFDMGGTSTDACLVLPDSVPTDQGEIAGLPLPLPTVDVHTVGCGGGSIAHRDRGGALCVGPHSAGADPGPACYGKGDEPTVTDAHMALGHLGPDTLLGGGFPVDVDRSVRAIERLARRLGLSPRRTAEGILAVADVHMARALMVVTVERAIDPAGLPLVDYGGAGGLHACSLAAQLDSPCAIVPPHPGAFSALGLALAGESSERVEPVRELLRPATERELRRRARALLAAARADLGAPAAAARVDAVMRFRGQGGGLSLRLRAGEPLGPAFLAAHAQRFGFTAPGTPIEIVQLAARAETQGRAFPGSPASGHHPTSARVRRAPLGGPPIRVFRREEIGVGQVLQGPCVVEEPTASTRVPGGFAATSAGSGLRLAELSV